MNPQWQRVEELYFAAKELEPAAQAAFLAETCGNDLQLRSEVESLLAAQAGEFLERPALDLEAEILAGQLPQPIEGRSLNHYRIISLLGAGGMAEVYLGRDTQLDRPVAIKVLHGSAIDDDSFGRFHREARLLASLNHPNIASVYGFERTGDISALVMELVEGETLSERISRGPLPLDAILNIARQIAAGVEAAHAANIIHRDLKPSNVKVAPDGTVKVLDFGLAKIVRPLRAIDDSQGTRTVTSAYSIVGTVGYMSPEQTRGKDVDKRTDVWSWACILYELLTGTRAFEGETPTDAIARIVSEEPDWTKLPKDTPEHVRSLLAGCLQKDPDRRIQSITLARLGLDQPVLPVSPAESDIAISVPAARALFLLIQAGYLAMYCTVLFYVASLEDALLAAGFRPIEITQPAVIVTAMAGVAVRLYLLSSVGFRHHAAGKQFRRLFPALLVLDGVWAASPLLASRTIGFGAALAAVAGLAYLPFSQRTLIDRIYRS